MKSSIRHDHKYYQDLAHQLLEEWVRQDSLPAGSYGSSHPLSGNLALTETKNTRNKPRFRRSQKREDQGKLIERPYYPAEGRETTNGSRQIPHKLMKQYSKISKIMETIAQGTPDGPRYVMVLKYYYSCHSVEVVATQMKCSKATAKQLKRSAFDQVVLLLRGSTVD